MVQFPVRLIRGENLDFLLCTIPTVSRYEKYCVLGKHKSSAIEDEGGDRHRNAPSWDHCDGRVFGSPSSLLCGGYGVDGTVGMGRGRVLARRRLRSALGPVVVNSGNALRSRMEECNVMERYVL